MFPPSSSRTRNAATALRLTPILALVTILLLIGCSDSGSGPGDSTTVTPLSGAFDKSHRIQNAGSARVTAAGLGFLQSNIASLAEGMLGSVVSGGVLQVNVPTTTGSAGPLGYTLCPKGSDATKNPKVCVAELDLGKANFQVASYAPYDLHITGTLPIRIQDVQVQANLAICHPTLNIALNGDDSCPGGNKFTTLPVAVDIAIHADQRSNHAGRYGASRLEIRQVVDDAAASNSIKGGLEICGKTSCDALCCLTDLCTCALAEVLDIGFLKNAVAGAIFPQIKKTLATHIESMLCQKPDPAANPACPEGSSDDGKGICRYPAPDGSCVSVLLGTEGHMDLGHLVSTLSPGTEGALDVVFAAGGADNNTTDPSGKLAWGDLDVLPLNGTQGSGGATLAMMGGAEASPLSKCVKMSNLALPTGIPIPDEILSDVAPAGWPATIPGPHVGVAVSERFANYALNSLYNSGLLCVGISTESVPLLSSSTLGILAMSARDLGLQRDPQQVAIAVRPSQPPTVAFGSGQNLTTDPLLRLGLKEVSLDFYFFSLDRFIRFMTATFDVDVPMNLVVSSKGLTPVLNAIGITNGTVRNSPLLREDPKVLATSIVDLLAGLVGQALGAAMKPFDFNAPLAPHGLALVIPDTVPGVGSPGLHKIAKGTDNFLGLFAGLAVKPPVGLATASRARSRIEVTQKAVDPAGIALSTITPDNAPLVMVYAASGLDDGTRAVEYAYRVDTGVYHPFVASRVLDVRDPWLRVQGRHVVEVQARVVSDHEGVSVETNQVEVVIDVEPPAIQVGEVIDGKVSLAVHDRVTPDNLVRYKLDDGPWSEVRPAFEVARLEVGNAARIQVEARDEEGNVGSAQQDLIRGRINTPVAASTIGCSMVRVGRGQAPAGPLGILAGVLSLGLARLLKRRVRAPKRLGPVHRVRRALYAAATIGVAWSCGGCGRTATTPPPDGANRHDAGSSCAPNCTTLRPGLIGAYTSVAVAGGKLWVAGYSEADWDNDYAYGDLVAGTWDGDKVTWHAVDGVPALPAVDTNTFDVNGFRGGQTAPGDDVGLWTSIAAGPDDKPAIAYYDRTHRALKFARYDGRSWTVHTVETKPAADIGRYAKLISLSKGFALAYLSIEPGGPHGALISKLRVAITSTPKPTEKSWRFEDAVTADNTPCRASFCSQNQACIKTTRLCTATLDAARCTPACTGPKACVANGATTACVDTVDKTKLDAYPEAIADYIAMAPDGQGGFGLAYYDRPHGNIAIATKASGTWTKLVVDGAGSGAKGASSGDVGIGTSLFIDRDGDYHLTYVNGTNEGLRYVKVKHGKTVGTPEAVDVGLGLANAPFADGQHLVGDDSHVFVAPSGEVHVTYQDATTGTLRYAVGKAGTTGHSWAVKTISQDGFAGAFSNIVVVNQAVKLVNWWRVGGDSVRGDVRVLAP